MRIACWVSLLLAATGACTGTPRGSDLAPAAEAFVAGGRTEGGRTLLELRVGDDHRSVMLERDDTVAPETAPDSIETVAKVRGAAIVIIDTYRSRAGGMSYCQAGEERFLRVISTVGQGATVRYGAKVGSCLHNLELADPGVVWDATTATLHVHWLLGPNGKEDERTIAVRPDGRAEAVPAR